MSMKMAIVEEKYCFEEEETELTIQKTSTFNHGDGFAVYDAKGDHVFRVDALGPLDSHRGCRHHHHLHHRILLMDPLGHPILTLLPKEQRPSLHHRWEGYLGEKSDGGDQPSIFSVWKSTMIGRSRVMVEVYSTKPPAEYQIEGCFSERRCTISKLFNGPDHDTSKVTVAQIKQKEGPTKDIVFGRDVFNLNIKAGFDGAFAMALVLALDRIDGHES